MTMRLRKLAKDGSSATGECPAVYDVEEDPAAMVVQGTLLDAGTMANLEDHSEGETAVRIPAETMVRAVRRYVADRGDPT